MAASHTTPAIPPLGSTHRFDPNRPSTYLESGHLLLANSARCSEHLTSDRLALISFVHAVCERTVVAVTESERRRTHRSAPETLVESNGTEPDAGPFVRYNIQEYVFGAVRVWQ